MEDITKLNSEGEIDLTGIDTPDIPTESQEPVVEPQEPVQNNDPVKEPVNEPKKPVEPTGPTQDQSSLTPEPTPVPQEPVTADVIDEAKMLEYLSEKLDKPLASLDDLITKPAEPTVNPLEEDPQLKEIYEWRKKTGRPLTDWVKFQKDYDNMSNMDVAREILQYKYPDLTPEELSLELSNYTPNEDDLDEDRVKKNLALKKFAIDGRKELNTLKSKLDTALPNSGALSEEEKQKISLFDKYQEQITLQQQQAEKSAKEYNDNVAAQISTFKSIPLKLSEDLSIDYEVTDASRGSIQDFMQMKHWYNKDGSFKHDEIVKDSFFIQNRESIIKLAFEQGVAKGKEEIDVDSRNVNLGNPRQTMASSNTDVNEIIIEGDEGFHRGQRGTQTRF